MRKEEYIGTIEIRGYKVDVGMDDYGQQYFFEYEEDGEIKTIGCGAFQTDFIECICYHFDPKGWRISMFGEEALNNWIQHIKDVMADRITRGASEDVINSYKEKIYHLENDDYDLYDFNALYKNLGLSR